MKKLSGILIGLIAPTFLFAQNDIDALRYSQSSLTGTARYVGLGGAFGALGADFSSLSDNPAGLGLYRHSEFTFTPSFGNESSTSEFLNNTNIDNKYDFNIANLGFVFSNRVKGSEKSDGWKRVNFAIGYNRLNDFNTRTTYQGINTNNSYLDYILNGNASTQGANGTSPANLYPFDQQLAYQTYLINPNSSDSTQYTSVIPHAGEQQTTTTETSGHQGEVVLSAGANYDNRFFIGATVGIDYIDYNQVTNYSETDVNNNIPDFNSFTLTQYLNTTGVGVNFKFGMIFAANSWIRLGAAIHTPTFYSMTDNYSSTMISSLVTEGSFTAYSPQGSFDYNLQTPYKAIGSVAFILGKRGLLSADYEYVDYSTMRLTSDNPSDFTDVNNTIEQKYTSTGNIKVGTEWRLADVFRVRAGYAYFGSPFASGYAVTGADQSAMNYSAGFGIRDNSFSIDFAYIYSITHNYTQEYSLTNEAVPGAINKVEYNNVLVTLGFRF